MIAVEERLERCPLVTVIRARRTQDRVRVQGGELSLPPRSPPRSRKRSKVSFNTWFRPRLRPVDLVHDEDGAVAAAERLAEDELCLRHRAVDRVDEQQYAIDHVHDPLDLAAEVGVARRIDNVDLHAAVHHGGVLGHDRDAPLALQGVAVHHPLGHLAGSPGRCGSGGAIPSTSVVLPWSTWAMIAMLRMSVRFTDVNCRACQELSE